MGGAALTCVALACAWTLCACLSGGSADPVATGTVEATAQDGGATAEKSDRLTIARAAAHAYAVLFDSRFLGLAPQKFARSESEPQGFASRFIGLAPEKFARSDEEPQGFASRFLGLAPQRFTRNEAGPATPSPQANVATKVNSPPAGPSRTAQNTPAPRAPVAHVRTALLRESARERADANPPPEKPSIFERLFGKPIQVALAYASPDDSGLTAGQDGVTGRYDRSTAVYDITAHTVYMPDGTRLEAHSGLGSLLDDPRHADAKDRGVTPPTVYDLKPREELFHGVRALRLIPEDEKKALGRTGLLAHSFMLGPNGDSNGCVSFRNYEAFLRAYQNHEISRLAVVTRLD